MHFSVPGGKELAAVQGITFQIFAGETVALLGESGCGKTTTALCLIGLLPPGARVLRGSVQFRGRELLNLDETELRAIRGAQIACIAQEPGLALNPVMRVGDQIAEVVRAHRAGRRHDYRKEARAALEQVCFAEAGRIFDAYPHQLSGGQQQRVLLAQALVCGPSLLIADEPTSALDAVLQAEMLALLKDLRQRLGLALLFISHNPAVVASLADRVLIMYAGRIVEQAGAAQIRSKPFHPYTQALWRCVPSPGARKQPLPVIPAGSPKGVDGCVFAPRCPAVMEVCGTRHPADSIPEADRQVCCFLYE